MESTRHINGSLQSQSPVEEKKKEKKVSKVVAQISMMSDAQLIHEIQRRRAQMDAAAAQEASAFNFIRKYFAP